MQVRNTSTRVVCVALLGVALMALAACSNIAGPNGDADAITAQASGKFSGGTIFSGSVNGIFEAVGLGNTTTDPYLVEMTVVGEVWFSCINKGGNEAPGQLAFMLGDQGIPQPTADADRNGKFVTDKLTVDVTQIGDDKCTRNKNWRVKTWADTDPDLEWPAGTKGTHAVTYLQPESVTALLFEAKIVGYDVNGRPILEKVENQDAVDALTWTCEAPAPTYPLEHYEFATIAPLSEVCTQL